MYREFLSRVVACGFSALKPVVQMRRVVVVSLLRGYEPFSDASLVVALDGSSWRSVAFLMSLDCDA